MAKVAYVKAKVLRGGAADAGLSRCDFFGELGLLDEAERTASVSADTDLWAARLPGESFFDLLGHQPTVARGLLWPWRSVCEASNPSALDELSARKTISLTATRTTTGTATKVVAGTLVTPSQSLLAKVRACDWLSWASSGLC